MESFKLDNIFSFPNIIISIMGVYAILVWISQQIQKRLWRRDMIRVNLFFEKAIKDKRQDIWVREEGYTSGCLNWYSQYGFDKDFRSRTVKMSRQYKTGDYVEWSHSLRSAYDHDLLVAYSVENEDTLLRVKLGSYGIPYFSDLSLLDSELKEKPYVSKLTHFND